jgi:hypothetical protein
MRPLVNSPKRPLYRIFHIGRFHAAYAQTEKIFRFFSVLFMNSAKTGNTSVTESRFFTAERCSGNVQGVP